MKNHRSGGKIGGNHTTLIDLASVVTDIASGLPEVTTVSPGFIKSGAGTTGGQKRVKIADGGRFYFIDCPPEPVDPGSSSIFPRSTSNQIGYRQKPEGSRC
jgi:hypothetical protein